MSDEQIGCISLIDIILTIALVVMFSYIFYKEGYKYGYLESCKDIAQGKSKAELRTLPGGEKSWVLKTEKEIKNAN